MSISNQPAVALLPHEGKQRAATSNPDGGGSSSVRGESGGSTETSPETVGDIPGATGGVNAPSPMEAPKALEGQTKQEKDNSAQHSETFREWINNLFK